MEEKTSGYDIRTILHEMRDEYWQGLAEAEEVREEELESVTFLLGGERYAFETVYAAEVIRVPRLVKVPQVPEGIVGVFNLRGEIVAAMDIRPILGLQQPALGITARIIVVKTDTFTSGLIVEGVEGVSGLPLSTFEPLVKSVTGAQRDHIRGQLNHGGSMVMLLDIMKLLADPSMVVDHE
jgi:purine-binding chemotaxis protein CheW